MFVSELCLDQADEKGSNEPRFWGTKLETALPFWDDLPDRSCLDLKSLEMLRDESIVDVQS